MTLLIYSWIEHAGITQASSQPTSTNVGLRYETQHKNIKNHENMMIPYATLIQPAYSDKINHLRALAALWIYVFHYYHFIAQPFFAPLNSLNPFLLLVYHGYFFVYLFFILSGFLLARAYSDTLDLKSFFVKRIGRLFPAYFLCIAVYSLVFTTAMPDPKLLVTIFSFDLGDYPVLIGHLWFINRLLECYLIFPLLWWIAHKTGQAGLSTIYLLCLLGGIYWVIKYQVPLPDYYFSLILCLSHFILGMLVGYQQDATKYGRQIVSVILVFVIVLEWFHQSTWQTPLGYSWHSIIWLNFIALLFVVLIRAYLFQAIYLPKVASVIMQKLGSISYTFYLYHFLVIHFFIMHREYLTQYNSLNFIGIFLVCILTAVFFQQLLARLNYGALYIKHLFQQEVQ